MGNRKVHMIKQGLLACLVASSVLLPATSGAFTAVIPSVSVWAGNGLTGNGYTSPIGVETLMGVMLAFPAGARLDTRSPDYEMRFDVYVGAILPDGRFASWVGDPAAPTLVTGNAPVPFLASYLPVPDSTQILSLRHTFGAADPQGWYILYGVVVNPGGQPLEPAWWNDASFFPLLVRSGL